QIALPVNEVDDTLLLECEIDRPVHQPRERSERPDRRAHGENESHFSYDSTCRTYRIEAFGGGERKGCGVRAPHESLRVLALSGIDSVRDHGLVKQRGHVRV